MGQASTVKMRSEYRRAFNLMRETVTGVTAPGAGGLGVPGPSGPFRTISEGVDGHARRRSTSTGPTTPSIGIYREGVCLTHTAPPASPHVSSA
jgi:hypothetical protein